MHLNHAIDIIPFTNDVKEEIKTLNLEWLTKYFKVEPKDELVLSNPQTEIIDKGGFIFYAKYQEKIVGTVSLLKASSNRYELSKMAVTDQVQGLGIGKKLMEFCIEFAKQNGFEQLFLYSNRSLHAAIHLYKSYGFVEVDLEEGVYERADIKMEKIIS